MKQRKNGSLFFHKALGSLERAQRCHIGLLHFIRVKALKNEHKGTKQVGNNDFATNLTCYIGSNNCLF